MERKKRYDEKLLLILESACGIFARKGYHNASIRDVATATGVSPAGLYYYFRSKEELLHLILTSCLTTLMDRIREGIDGIEDPATRLRRIVRTHLEQLDRQNEEMQVLVREWKALSGPYGEEIRKLMRGYVEIVIRTFRDLSPGKSPEELRAAAFGLFGMLTWVDQWHRPGRDLALDLLAEEFSGIFLGTFLSEEDSLTNGKRSKAEESKREWSKKDSTSSILAGPGF